MSPPANSTSRWTITSRIRTTWRRVTATITTKAPHPQSLATATFGDGFAFSTDVQNVSLEDNWSVTPTKVITTRFAVDRAVSPVKENYPTLQSVGFPSILGTGNGISRIPVIQMDNDATSLFNQCCTDTNFAHSLYSYNGFALMGPRASCFQVWR